MVIQLILHLCLTNQLHYIFFLIYFVLGEKKTRAAHGPEKRNLSSNWTVKILRARHIIPFPVWTW